MITSTIARRTRRTVVLMTTCLFAASLVPAPAAVQAEGDRVRVGAADRSSPQPLSFPTASRTHGAGVNHPRFNDFRVNYLYQCAGADSSRFRVTSASIYMWSRGDRIKGFQFKYRLVPAGTAGQIQAWSNWSKNVSVSFPQGSTRGQWMAAGALNQTRSVEAAWEMEVKLKYPRSLRPAKRYKYRLTFANPPCGSNLNPSDA